MDALNAIAGVCERYKIGTNCIASWLFRTATYPTSKNEGSRIPVYTGKSKHRASKPKPQVSSSEIELTTKQLLAYAACIEKNASPTQDPPEEMRNIISMVRDVIRCRKECAMWHSPQDSATADQSRKEGHAFFIKVLQDVQAHLERAVAKSSNAAPLRSTVQISRAPIELFSNSFGLLLVEEPVDSSGVLPARTIKSSHPSKPTKRNRTVTLQDQSMDRKAFDVWCAVSQGCEILDYIRTFWESRRNGPLVPYNTARTMLFAAEFIRDLASELEETYPELEDFAGFVASLSRSGSGTNARDEFRFSPALTMLRLLRVAQDCIGGPGEEDQTKQIGRAFHPLFEQLFSVKDGLIQKANLWDKGLDGSVDVFEAKDPLLHQMMFFFASGKVGLDMLLILQMSMEIYDEVQPRSDVEFKRLSTLVRRIEASVAESELVSGETLDQKGHGRNLLKVTNRLAPLTQSPSCTDYRRTLLQKFPLLCLTQTADLMELAHIAGVETANLSFEVLAVAYIYLACRDSRNVNNSVPAWEDMDHVLHVHSADGLGLSKRDTRGSSSLEVGKRFQRASAATYIEQRRDAHKKILPARAQPTIAPRRKLIRKCILMDLEDEEMAMNARLGFKGSHGIHRGVLGKLARKTMERPEHVDADIVQFWNKRRQLTPVQLLRILETSLGAQPDILDFDYHAFTADCCKVLTKILEQFEHTGFDRLMGGASTMSEKMEYLFWESANEASHISGTPTATLLDEAAEILAEFIA